jgi:hypothetical protein
VFHLIPNQDLSNLRTRVHLIFSWKIIANALFAPKFRVRKFEQASIFPVFAANRSPAIRAFEVQR